MVGKLVLAGVVLAFALAPASAPAGDGCGSQACLSDVSVSGAMTRSPVPGGGATTLDLRLADNGPDGAQGTILDFTAPAGVAVTGARGCDVQGTYVHCLVGDMATGETRQVLIGLRGERKGDYDLHATAYTGTYDPNRDNDTAHVQFEVSSTVATQRFTSSSRGSGAAPVRIRAGRVQRILKTGGIVTRVVPASSGSIDVHAVVLVPRHGPLTIAEQWRPHVAAGRAVSLYLGTTARMKRVLRSGFARAHRMRAVIRVRFQGGGRTTFRRSTITVVA